LQIPLPTDFVNEHHVTDISIIFAVPGQLIVGETTFFPAVRETAFLRFR
jgi:hypothetical protein